MSHKNNTLAPAPTTPFNTSKRKHHEFHCNGDINLESSDSVIFTVHKVELARSGLFFDDLFSIPQPAQSKKPRADDSIEGKGGAEDAAIPLTADDYLKADNTAIIPIEATSTVLSIFLDLCKVETPFVPQTDYTQTRVLNELCKKYLVQVKIHRKVLERLWETARVDNWTLLITASEEDDLAHAREALQGMTSTTFALRTSNSGRGGSKTLWQRLKLLPPSWQLSIISSVLREPENTKDMVMPASTRASKTPIDRGSDIALFVVKHWPQDWSCWDPVQGHPPKMENTLGSVKLKTTSRVHVRKA